MWEVSRDEDIARLTDKLIGNPLRRIVRLKMTRGRELRQRVACAPKALSGLLRAKLSAVPDNCGLGSLRGRIRREPIDCRAPVRRQWTTRIESGPDCVTMMNKVEEHCSLKSKV
jgi:hypothetical protein